MKLAIVGSTDLTPAQIVAVERMAKAFIVYYTLCVCSADDLVVISGGASGVDSIAEQKARDLLYLSPLIYYPAHPQWEPQGYKDRNRRIAEECDELISIRSRQSKTYGSGWTADRAEDLGKPVWRYYV